MPGSRSLSSFWILEDTSAYVERQQASLHGDGTSPVAIRLYKYSRGALQLRGETTYHPKKGGRRSAKAEAALQLLDDAKATRGVVVAGSRFMRAAEFLDELTGRRLDYVVALPSGQFERRFRRKDGTTQTLSQIVDSAAWTRARIGPAGSRAEYEVASLGRVTLGGTRRVRCIALAAGGIRAYRRSIIVGVTSLSTSTSVRQAAALLGWVRWLRVATRRAERSDEGAKRALRPAAGARPEPAHQLVLNLTARVNLRLSRRQDQSAADTGSAHLFDGDTVLRGVLRAGGHPLNVVELFAGAGGMGLGFLEAGNGDHPYRIVFSGEVNPTYVRTLQHNHEFLRRAGRVEADAVPESVEPVDLRASSAMLRIQRTVAEAGGAHVLIGGPPCQGFSNANRNSWSSDNPNNRLVDTYLDYVVRLRPKVLIMENVQGILWTPRHDAREDLSVAQHVAARLAKAGYRIYPKLLDAAWYGVPQHRNRFFLVGLHQDLGYAQDDFGAWGPFPRPTHGPGAPHPYVTVRDAIGDLPAVGNGEEAEEQPYAAAPQSTFAQHMRRWTQPDVVWDHVTSRHADYVIKRYERIPAGGNWSAITDMMTNYAEVERTHSNIYRRLVWTEPSITIGHYRKAMLIHPEQHRGLSLREAARLQSFPDWYRFAGSPEAVEGGLTFKQQQLANAVCPLVTRAVAEYLLAL